jgi:hypothetical protein
MLIYYYGIKAAFLAGLVQSYVKFDLLQKHWLFLSLLYTAGLAFLSWVFIMAPAASPDWRLWEFWLLKTFGFTVVYLLLLRRFDEGMIFWLLMLGGIAFLLYY